MANNNTKTRPEVVNKNVDFETIVEKSVVENVEDVVAVENETKIETPEADIKTVLSDINKAVDDISGNTASAEKPRSKKTKFELTEMISCKSLFLGKMIYTSPTNGARYIWKDFGAVEYVPFGELQTMNNHKPQYLNKPLLLINEPDVVEYFNLNPVYEKVANINKLDELLNSGDIALIRKKIQESIEVGMRDTVISKVRKMRQENKLVDINIIKALKEELKFDIE